MPILFFIAALVMLGFVPQVGAEDPPAIACGDDYLCYRQAVQSCRPARLRVAEHTQAGTLSRQTFWFQHEVVGPDAGQCLLSVRLSGMEILFTDAFYADMTGRGLSRHQLQDMQRRLTATQSPLESIFRVADPRTFRVSPPGFDTRALRRMNRSLLTKIDANREE